MNAKAWLAVLAIGALAGCAQMAKVEPGQVTIKDELKVTAAIPWNRFELAGMYTLSVAPGASEVWTQEGITLDALAFFVGVQDGQKLGAEMPGAQKTLPLYRKLMTPNEIVELYEQMVTQDGSSFTLSRIAPAQFGGQPGFRFEYTVARKGDSVLLKGIALGAVVRDKLYLAAYTAPAVYFFDKHLPHVRTLVATAAIRAP